MEIASSIPPERGKISSPATSPFASGGYPPPHPIPAASRSHESPSPHPTTFVQATASNFNQVVQMLTGSSVTGGGGGIPPIKSTNQKKQGFKLYERRNSLKSGLMINTMLPAGFSGRRTEILSPSMLDFPSLALLSPPTPLNGDSLERSAAAPSPTLEEERAIAEKKFYFHPSPRTKSGEPQLLPLFPVTSPRVLGSEN
ncbi:VQ motif-containing protein 4 [Striga hermonthica]|uniref:VQ motif-containing protein 4 n=1 Tax=Striga hermonthica TaxID=68872 RepID=A0A9N7R7F6_STRHE|nr:VQ motif-containing protein 4 [Striga hermonthica]